jgi:uncharacterized membrane protein YeaQ/YmgE (transglycosylase-associated protein family)
MEIILMLVLGAVAGWIASMITSSRNGIVMDIVLGIVGAFVGGFIMNFFGAPGVTGFDIYSLVVSVLGAIVAIFIGRAITRSSYAS